VISKSTNAPGKPGLSPKWTSSSKSGVGKAINALSNVSFTISHGIINEVYFPREDCPCIRDMELIVTDGKDFFAEEKRDTRHSIKMIKPGVPAYEITNECLKKEFVIEKEVVTDPLRNTLLQQIKFIPKESGENEYHVYVLLAPHLKNHGGDNTAWLGDHNGVPMLFAQRENLVLALACSNGWLNRSAGFVGASDGWTDIHDHKEMTWEYQRAEKGNVALTGEIDIKKSKDKTFTLSLGFGYDEVEAGHNAWGSLMDGFDFSKKRYTSEWEDWQKSLSHSSSSKSIIGKFSLESAAVLRAHEAKLFVGATIASMSFPWGASKGDEDAGGYHLVWPRDLVETAGGFLALNSKMDAFRVLNYLMITQKADGHWSQNMWIEGKHNWNGIQMDQMALPILLLDLCKRHNAIREEIAHLYWNSIKKAAAYIIQNGPSSQMDRWEEESGITLYTLAAEIAALLSAANFAEENDDPKMAAYCRETADYWNENIEHWTYVANTPLAQKTGVEGYYIRINPGQLAAENLHGRYINLKNHSGGEGAVLLNELVSPDALALVRYGLRAADDPHILNTIKVIDEVLMTDTPSGPCWHRYNKDGYGEHENGSSFDGSGIGRGWPLLVGERAHYEIAAGNLAKAKKLLKTMEGFANNGLFSEQVWDTDDIPEKELFRGRPSGSAMPLVWAQAEYIKLCSSIKDKKVFDMPLHTVERYIKKNAKKTDWVVWRFEYPCSAIPKGKNLRIETKSAARIHWSVNDWKTTNDVNTRDTELGVHVAELKLKTTKAKSIVFTFFWDEDQHWENKNFEVQITNH
jgi:glucoamylase